MGAGTMGGTESAGNYWRTDAKRIMIRAFDFTVQEDTSYRYRVRIVVFNPNLGRDDTAPGVDQKGRGTARGVERGDRPGRYAPGHHALRDGFVSPG